MARKSLYYYDEETCTFQEEKLTRKQLGIKVAKELLIALVLAGLGMTIYLNYDDPKTSELKKQLSEQEATLGSLISMVGGLENHLDKLHKRDKTFYRSILGMKESSEDRYQGGVGGQASVSANSDADELFESAERAIQKLSHKIRKQEESYDQVTKKLSNNKSMLSHIPAIKPVEGGVISYFGMRMHPILKFKKMHTGLDFQASTGTKVYATGDAVVRFVGKSRGGYGNQIELDHGYGYITKYAHLSRFNVKKGQKVKRGDVIGFSGNTGLSKGPHLHYEVIRSDKKVNPLDHLTQAYTPLEYKELKDNAQKNEESMD